MQGQLDWFKGGILLAFVFLIAVWVVKPIGVSTQFVITDGIIWNSLSDGLVIENPQTKSGYESKNSYLNKSGGKYAKNVANPLNYSFIFVIAIMIGAFISNMTKGPKPTVQDKIAPEIWRQRFGNSGTKRYILAFAGGILVLFGARLAGGCTSGHMMSGMMQTSLSGYIFALGAFTSAVPLSIYIYNKNQQGGS